MKKKTPAQDNTNHARLNSRNKVQKKVEIERNERNRAAKHTTYTPRYRTKSTVGKHTALKHYKTNHIKDHTYRENNTHKRINQKKLIIAPQ